MLKRIFGSKKALLVLSMLTMAIVATGAFAYTDPATGDLFYDAYDIVINKLLGGPIGFIIGAIMVVGGIISLVLGKGFLLPLIALIGGAIIVKIGDIVSSFGFTLDAVNAATTKAAVVAPHVTQFLF